MITTKSSNTHKSIWENQKAKLHARFPKLTDSDLDFDETNKNEMLGKLEFKLGLTVSELQVIMETL